MDQLRLWYDDRGHRRMAYEISGCRINRKGRVVEERIHGGRVGDRIMYRRSDGIM